MRAPAIPLAATLLLVAPACTKPTAELEAELADETIVLLDQGAEPRTRLRYAVEPGQSEVLALTMAMTMTLDFGELVPAQTHVLPPITIYSRTSVESVSGDQIVEQLELERHEVGGKGDDPAQAQLAALMSDSLAKLDDYRQTLTIDTRGNIRAGSLSLPQELDPQLAESLQSINRSLEQVLMTWPSKPVGVGARWRKTNTLASSGLEVEQTTTIELLRLADESVTLATTIEQSPTSETLSLPNLPPGASASLTAFESSGRGETVYELGHLVPRSGRSTMRTKVVIEVALAGQTQKVATEIELEVTLARVPG